MDQESVIADIEYRARMAAVSIRQVCIEAGVHPTTFSRWKKSERNPDPQGANLKLVEELYKALDRLAGPQRRRRSGPSGRSAAA
jgi:hypothetical protein